LINKVFFKYSHLANSLGSNSYPQCPGFKSAGVLRGG
jgi:hypothetical protein